MSPVPDDFEQLRRLLALKRYEQPPPGYFHGFSREVIVRIKAGELGEPEGSGWSFAVGSLFQRVWATLDARPVLAGAFGVAVCGFFVVGALLSDSTTADSTPLPVPPNNHLAAISSPWDTEPKAEFSSFVPQPSYQPPAGSLFSEIQQQQTKRIPVSFSLTSGESN